MLEPHETPAIRPEPKTEFFNYTCQNFDFVFHSGKVRVKI